MFEIIQEQNEDQQFFFHNMWNFSNSSKWITNVMILKEFAIRMHHFFFSLQCVYILLSSSATQFNDLFCAKINSLQRGKIKGKKNEKKQMGNDWCWKWSKTIKEIVEALNCSMFKKYPHSRKRPNRIVYINNYDCSLSTSIQKNMTADS